MEGSNQSSSDDSKDLCTKYSNINVYLRIRPLQDKDLIQYSIDDKKFTIENFKTGSSKLFTFTHIFGPKSTQSDVYKGSVHDLMINFIKGNNATIMAYGTSGAGKTFSMLGTVESPGIVPRILYDVFQVLPVSERNFLLKPNDNMESELIDNVTKNMDLKNLNHILKTCDSKKRLSLNAYSSMKDIMDSDFNINVYETSSSKTNFIWVSFAEIYNENVYDLLDTKQIKNGQTRKKLKIMENKHNTYFIKDLSKIPVRNGEEAFKILKYGQKNLQYASTKINAYSSRSHCIFTIYLVKFNGTTAMANCFNFCDLAGSERLSNTNNTGVRLKEAQSINSALHVLGRCIKITQENQKNKTQSQIVPFRESKLTRIFHKALQGEERLSLLVNIHPKTLYFEETMNSLNFAAIARSVIVHQKEQDSHISKVNITSFFKSVPSSTICEPVHNESDEYESEDDDSYIQEELLHCIASRDERIYELEIEMDNLKIEMMENERKIRQELTDKFEKIFDKRVEYYEDYIKKIKTRHEEEIAILEEFRRKYESDSFEDSQCFETRAECSQNESNIINISDDSNKSEST